MRCGSSVRDAFDGEVARLREMPYSLWRQVVGSPVKKPMLGADNRNYLFRLKAEYVIDSDDIRVTLTLAPRSWLPRVVLRQAFVLASDNTFRR